jgi:hypothetical protein
MKHTNRQKENALAKQRAIRTRRIKVLEPLPQGVLLTASRRLP